MTPVTHGARNPKSVYDAIAKLIEQGNMDNRVLKKTSGVNSLGYVGKVKSRVLKRFNAGELSSNPSHGSARTAPGGCCIVIGGCRTSQLLVSAADDTAML